MLLLVLLAQVALVDETSAPSPVASPTIFVVSPGGAWLAVGEPDRVHVLDARTLTPKAVVEVAARSAAFDGADAVLTLAGDDVIRIETGSWRGISRAPLADVAPARVPPPRLSGRARFRLEAPASSRRVVPGVLAAPAGEVYYVATDGFVRRGPEGLDLGGRDIIADGKILGLLAMAGGTPVVQMDSMTAVVARGRAFTLVSSQSPIEAAALGGRLVLLGSEWELVYDTTTWKAIVQRPIREGRALAVASVRAWAFTADAEGIHAWRPDVPGRRLSVGPPVGRLAVDRAATALLAADSGRLRRWRIEAP